MGMVGMGFLNLKTVSDSGPEVRTIVRVFYFLWGDIRSESRQISSDLHRDKTVIYRQAASSL